MTTKNRRSNIIWTLICLFCTFIFAFPFMFAIVNSLRSIYDGPVMWFPEELHWENYKHAVTLIPFWRYFLSSMTIVCISVFFGITLDFVYGYAFARLTAKYRRFFWMVVMAQLMIPSSAISIPQYMAFKNLGVKDTYWIWVLSGLAGNVYTIFRYKQYIENIPKELEEAAFMDGCGFFRIIKEIYYPLCRNVVVISFFSHFTSAWGEYMTPFMYLTQKKYPLALALFNGSYRFPEDIHQTTEPIVVAAGLIFGMVSVIVFAFCQKELTAGITEGGIKG